MRWDYLRVLWISKDDQRQLSTKLFQLYVWLTLPVQILQILDKLLALQTTCFTRYNTFIILW